MRSVLKEQELEEDEVYNRIEAVLSSSVRYRYVVRDEVRATLEERSGLMDRTNFELATEKNRVRGDKTEVSADKRALVNGNTFGSLVRY